MSAVITCQAVDYAYAQTKVLENIHLSIAAEEFFGLIGPNAAGKSTLLKLLLGVLAPDAGTIDVLGAAPGLAGSRIGYVPQAPSFPKNFPVNVLDVVLLGRLGRHNRPGGFTAKDRDMAMQALEVAEITALSERPIQTLSGGQVQRMLIARALACRPEILILDEPTANIDIQAEENIFALLKQYNARMTIIVVSHDIAFISAYVDRVGCLNRTLVCHETQAISGKTIEELYGVPVRMIHHAHQM